MGDILRSALETISIEREGWEVPDSDTDDCKVSMPFYDTVLTFMFRDLPEFHHQTLVVARVTLMCCAPELVTVLLVLNSANIYANFGRLFVVPDAETDEQDICYEHVFEAALPDWNPEILADILDDMYSHFSMVWSCLTNVMKGMAVDDAYFWLQTVSDRHPN